MFIAFKYPTSETWSFIHDYCDTAKMFYEGEYKYMASLSLCGKSKRGVVIWNPRFLQYVGAWNTPPDTFICLENDLCRKYCGKLCVHAEQHALLKARDILDKEVEMLHIKVSIGLPVVSDKPSCLECSKLILEAGIKVMWLLEESGLVCYTAREFHLETIKNVLGDEGTRLLGSR